MCVYLSRHVIKRQPMLSYHIHHSALDIVLPPCSFLLGITKSLF